MDITPLVSQGRQIINGYGAGGFTVGGVPHAGSLLILPDRTLPWAVADIASLTVDSLLPVIKQQVELLLLGCGAQMQPVPPAIRTFLREHGIGLDIMDTGAACRTYNVLMMEDRRVAAALMSV